MAYCIVMMKSRVVGLFEIISSIDHGKGVWGEHTPSNSKSKYLVNIFELLIYWKFNYYYFLLLLIVSTEGTIM